MMHVAIEMHYCILSFDTAWEVASIFLLNCCILYDVMADMCEDL